MRKIVILGLLASMLTIVTAPVLAGSVEDCDTELKFEDVTPGLYGLCIAWHNAGSDNARASIERAYEKKATGPNDPVKIPGSDDGYLCPCWDDTVIANAAADGVLIDCQSDPGGPLKVEFAIYLPLEPAPGIYAFQVEDTPATEDDPAVFGCFYTDPYGGGQSQDFSAATPAEAIQRCRDDIEVMCSL